MNNYTSIITTHQARLRCMLHDIISKNPDLMNKKSELHRFQNGCIIHLEILPTTLKLSLLHNLSTKEIVLSTFEKLKKELQAISNELLVTQNNIREIADKPQTMSLLETAYADLARVKEELQNILLQI